MNKLLIAGEVVHADETTVQVLHESGRKGTTDSRMWIFCNGRMNDRSTIVFEYQPTRGGKHSAAFLKGFVGYLICDGYDTYTAVKGVRRCGCWMRFVESRPKEKSAY